MLLALVATRVSACEYGQDGTTTVVAVKQPAVLESPAAVVPGTVAPIVSNLPSLLV